MVAQLALGMAPLILVLATFAKIALCLTRLGLELALVSLSTVRARLLRHHGVAIRASGAVGAHRLALNRKCASGTILAL